MGNKVVFSKYIDLHIFNQDVSLSQQIQHLGTQSYPHIDRVDLYKLKNEVTKLPTIFEKRLANTILIGNDQQLINLHKQVEELNHPNLIKYYGVDIYKELTTNLVESKWYYEALFRTSKNLCAHHFQYKSLIPEKELWKMLDQIVSAMEFLDQKQEWHLQIQPDSIYQDYQGTIKLIPKGILRMLSGYTIVLKKQGQALLSPELIEQLKLNNANPEHDPCKSDIFSLGICFLEFMTLKNCFECYTLNQIPQLNDKKVEQLLEEAEFNGYSEDFVKIIRHMLTRDPNYRLNIRDIKDQRIQMQNKQALAHNFSPLRPSFHQDFKPSYNQESVRSNQQVNLIQPSIPIVNQNIPQMQIQNPIQPFEIPQQIDYLPQQQKQQSFQISEDELLFREQQINKQLEIQLKQQQSQLQHQYQLQQRQQQIIEEQQQQLFLIQQQIQLISQQIAERKQIPIQQIDFSQIHDNSNYQINVLPTPPITYASPIKHTLNDFTENIEIQNRVNQVLAQSRQALNKYQK